MKLRLICLCLFLLWAAPAMAHKVTVFAWVEAGRVYTQSGFGADRPAKNCRIRMEDEKGRVIHEGRTDENGHYDFETPDHLNGDVMIVLTAGEGHRGTWKITRDELAAQGVTDTAQNDQNKQAAEARRRAVMKGPSAARILIGLAAIFLIAGGITLLKKHNRRD